MIDEAYSLEVGDYVYIRQYYARVYGNRGPFEVAEIVDDYFFTTMELISSDLQYHFMLSKDMIESVVKSDAVVEELNVEEPDANMLFGF